MGISLDSNAEYLVYVNILIGHTYTYGSHGRMSAEKRWSNIKSTYPEIIIVKDIATHNPKFTEFKTVAEVFTPKSKVFMLNTIYYGCLCEVIDTSLYDKCGRIKGKLKKKKHIQNSTIVREFNFNA